MPSRRTRKTQSIMTAVELAFAVPQVVAHRVTRMALAGPTLSERDRKEFQRMGAEKAAAFNASWNAMTRQALHTNQNAGGFLFSRVLVAFTEEQAIRQYGGRAVAERRTGCSGQRHDPRASESGRKRQALGAHQAPVTMPNPDPRRQIVVGPLRSNVIAPGKARRFLRGESPRRTRASYPYRILRLRRGLHKPCWSMNMPVSKGYRQSDAGGTRQAQRGGAPKRPRPSTGRSSAAAPAPSAEKERPSNPPQ